MTAAGLTGDHLPAPPLPQPLEKERQLRFAYLVADTPPRRLTDLEQLLI